MRPLSRPGPPKGDCPKGLSKRTDKCSHEKWWECECPWQGAYKGVSLQLNNWWRDHAPEGHSKTIATFEAAKRVFSYFKDAVDQGTYEKPPIAKDTFADLVRLFKTNKVGMTTRVAKAGPRKGKEIEVLSGVLPNGDAGEHDPSVLYMLDDYVEKFGRHKLTDLENNTLAFEGFLDELQVRRKWGHGSKIRAKRTWNRWYQLGRRLFKYAIKKRLVTQTPFGLDDFAQKPEGSRRQRRIPPEQEEAILQVFAEKALNTLTTEWPHLSEEMEARWYAAFQLGLRRTEMLLIQNKHITKVPEGYRIELPPQNTKAGKTTGETLFAYATKAEIIKTIESRKFLGPEAFTFGTVKGEKIDSFDKAWESLFQMAGLNPKDSVPRFDPNCFIWHDLRHEYISRLVDAGAERHEVMELGRLTDAVVAVYMAAKKDRLWAIAKKM